MNDKRLKIITLIVMLITGMTSSNIFAKNLGVFGRTFEIDEPDLLEQIMAKLKEQEANGELEKQRQEMVKRAKEYVQRPTGVSLPRAEKINTHYYNPELVLKDAVRDQNGAILYPPGTTVNPLDYASLTNPMVFFDADDETQKTWVWNLIKDNPLSYITLLTNGAVIDTMKEWNTRLYFDQRGTYVEKFNIRTLPAVVRQEGRVLRIDEIPPESGYVEQ